MKVYRYRGTWEKGPKLLVVSPDGPTSLGKYTSLGATLTATQFSAERGTPGEWKIEEEDGTLRATITKTEGGQVLTRIVY